MKIMKLAEKLKKIRLLILDVDGVLTDGSIFLDACGNELKRFNVLDGHGIKSLQQSGVKVAIISARNCPATAYRAQTLGIDHIYQGQRDKTLPFTKLKEILCLDNDQIAYVGDDVVDLSVMSQIGCAIAVANAHTSVKKQADITTTKSGGKGAVREVCDWLLQANNT